MTGECYDDSAFDESVIINDATPTSVTLSVASGQRHDGTAGTGARIVDSTTTRQLLFSAIATCQWLEINGQNNLSGGSPSARVLADHSSSTPVVLARMIVHDCLALNGINVDSAALNILNCIVYDIDNAGSGVADTVGVNLSGVAGGSNVRVHNVTIHSITRDVSSTARGVGLFCTDDSGDFIQNVLVTDTTGSAGGTHADFDPASPSTGTFDHNASSDTTASGTGSLTSITTADQYVSTVNGSEDLHLKTGSVCIDAGVDLGTTPSGVEIDIDGRDRDAEGDTWDIGADELVVFDPALQVPLMHDITNQPFWRDAPLEAVGY